MVVLTCFVMCGICKVRVCVCVGFLRVGVLVICVIVLFRLCILFVLSVLV